MTYLVFGKWCEYMAAPNHEVNSRVDGHLASNTTLVTLALINIKIFSFPSCPFFFSL